MLTVLPMPEYRRRNFWPLLVFGLAVATLVPIGVHTVLLDNLGVPYPADLPRSGWTILPDHALLVLGIIWLNEVIRRGNGSGRIGRLAFIFFAVAALNQVLFRLPIMRNVVSTKWTIYPFIDNIPAALWFAVAAGLVVLVAHFTTTALRKAGAAVVIAFVLDRLLAPATAVAFSSIIAANAPLEGDQLYSVPYDWHVDVPSYLTFIEPALGAIVIAMVLRRLRLAPLLIVGVLFALQGGPLVRVILNIWYAPLSPSLAMLSEGQFALEALALAVLASGVAVLLTSMRPREKDGTNSNRAPFQPPTGV